MLRKTIPYSKQILIIHNCNESKTTRGNVLEAIVKNFTNKSKNVLDKSIHKFNGTQVEVINKS